MRCYLAILVIVLSLPFRAQAADCDLLAGESVTVTKALDGETLLLDDGGQVRLAGIVTPRAPLVAAKGALAAGKSRPRGAGPPR